MKTIAYVSVAFFLVATTAVASGQAVEKEYYLEGGLLGLQLEVARFVELHPNLTQDLHRILTHPI
jgi:hypothetical protein